MIKNLQRMATECTVASDIVTEIKATERMLQLLDESMQANEELRRLNNENDSKQSTISELLIENEDLNNKTNDLDKSRKFFMHSLRDLQHNLSRSEQTIAGQKATIREQHLAYKLLNNKLLEEKKAMREMEVVKLSLEFDIANQHNDSSQSLVNWWRPKGKLNNMTLR
jgi:chromosome segregation ATPase